MDRLGDVDPGADLHDALPSSAVPGMPRPACIALQGHQGQRAISGRSKAATWAAKPPEPSKAAGMTAIPASPAPQQLQTTNGARQWGKAA
jgi:hypothetical protein